MFIDAFVVGKSVDLFNKIDLVKPCSSLATGIPVMLIGLVIISYTQYTYMAAALGCGPRDTLLVGIVKKLKKDPAVVAAPLLTTVIDLCAIVIYFQIATTLLTGIKGV